MKTQCGCEMIPRHTTRWMEAARFLGSVIALWSVCAAGIYLIGPAEAELAVAVAQDTHPQSGAHALVTTAVYRP